MQGVFAADVAAQHFDLIHGERLEQQQATGLESAANCGEKRPQQEPRVDDNVEEFGSQVKVFQVGMNRMDVGLPVAGSPEQAL